MQAQQSEQMKLYNQVGINPLSGCIPLLLQMPVLFAMFNFFPNSIELRQQTLWWAQDLSTYDDLISFSFAIPFLGTHLSIFNVLLMFSTLGITYFNNQNTAVNPQMAYIGYVMPVVLMFVLNDLPAGLNFYYLCSNVMSMTQQVLIRRFVDEDSIHRKLQENKSKNANKPKSKFTQRLEEAMRSAEEVKKQQDANKKKKK
jgi:YidC/Oxa1 family membrane protein insertase